jgi:hypothetical protein
MGAVLIWVILVVFALLMTAPLLYGVAARVWGLCRLLAARLRRVKAR